MTCGDAVELKFAFGVPKECKARLTRRLLKIARAIKLPAFTTSGMTLFKRMALVIDDGVIVKAFYPVFPPDKNAAEVVAWLRRDA